MRDLISRLLHRTEPPGVWHGKPHLYSRWRVEGRDYQLTEVQHYYDPYGAEQIVLSYRTTVPGFGEL